MRWSRACRLRPQRRSKSQKRGVRREEKRRPRDLSFSHSSLLFTHFSACGPRLCQGAIERSYQVSLGDRADNLLFDLAALDDEQVGDSAHAITRRGRGIVVNIDLDDLELAGILVGQFIEDRWDRLARS